MKIMLLTLLSLLSACDDKPSNYNLNKLIDTYVFLSENHDLLHIMMGEYEGSPIDSYRQYQQKINLLKSNIYLEPILLGLKNINVTNDSKLENSDKFDALVDYYQIGTQMMIDGILKGYGYTDMPQNPSEYHAIKDVFQ